MSQSQEAAKEGNRRRRQRVFVDANDGIIVSSTYQGGERGLTIVLSLPSTDGGGGADDGGDDIIFRAQNSGGYLTGDLVGIGGLEQILLLPNTNIDGTKKDMFDTKKKATIDVTKEDEDGTAAASSLEEGKRTFCRILQHSVLTDGIDVMTSFADQMNFGTLVIDNEGGVGGGGRRKAGVSSLSHVPCIEMPSISLDELLKNFPITEHQPKQADDKSSSKKRKTKGSAPPSATDGTSVDSDSNSSKEVAKGNDSSSLSSQKKSLLSSAALTLDNGSNKLSQNDPDNDNLGKKKYWWTSKLERGIQTRLQNELKRQNKIDMASKVQMDLVRKSREVLNDMATIRNGCASILDDSAGAGGCYDAKADEQQQLLELVRIRYTTRPGASTAAALSDGGAVGGLAFTVHMEIDVLLRPGGDDDDDVDADTRRTRTAKEEGVSSSSKSSSPDRLQQGSKTSSTTEETVKKRATDALHGLHLSISPASSSTTAGGGVKVHTQSGVVPTLQCGECVTVVALVTVTNVTLLPQPSIIDPTNDDDDGEEQVVVLAINALWQKGQQSNSFSSSGERNSGSSISITQARQKQGHETGSRRVGVTLGLFRLPLESMILLSTAPTTTMHHVIDFSAERQQQTNGGGNKKSVLPPSVIIPSATFECRNPRVITVYVSKCNDVGGEEDDWDKFVHSINEATTSALGNRIDLYRDTTTSAIIKLVVFASTPQERLALVTLVLRYLPESASIVEDCNNRTHKSHYHQDEGAAAMLLLKSIQREVDAMDRYCRSTSSSSSLKKGAGAAAATEEKEEEKGKNNNQSPYDGDGGGGAGFLTEIVRLQCHTDELAARVI